MKLGPGAPDWWKLRREANGDHWLEIPIDAARGSGSLAAPLVVEVGQNRSEVQVQLMVTVPVENLVVTHRELDFGELDLASVKTAAQRIGIRKLVGSFRIKALSSTLPFLKLESTTMIDGSNYRIRITVDPAKPLKPGAYSGVVVIEIDTGQRVELPIKLKLVDR